MGKNRLVLLSAVAIIFVVVGIFVWSNKQIEKSAQKKVNTEIKTEVKTSPTITSVPTLYPTSMVTQVVIPTATTAPTQTPPTSIPIERIIIPLNTPAPPADTIAPTIKIISGPSEGLTLASVSFCFVIQVSDNNTYMTARNKLDNSNWTEWGAGSTQSNPCFQNVAVGNHTFYVEAKDQTGNTASISRSFTTTTTN